LVRFRPTPASSAELDSSSSFSRLWNDARKKRAPRSRRGAPRSSSIGATDSPRFFPRRCGEKATGGVLFVSSFFETNRFFRRTGFSPRRAAPRCASRTAHRPEAIDDGLTSLFSFFLPVFPETAHCSSVGTVVQSEVARQPGGRSKGWGLVDYESPEAATAAITQLHNSELQGRSIIVRLERAGGANKSGGVNAGRPEASSGLQIVVRNLPWSTTSEDLRQVFQQVGNVVKADAVCHADTGRSKGWGTVLFETTEQAQAAIQGFNGVELEHRPMQIKLDRYD
jgi:hypothetical protein